MTTIDPMPPVATGVALPWDAQIDDAVAEIGAARAAHGDTFVVDSGSDRYLFTFDPAGVRSFYRLPENAASKGVADWRMLRRKMPEEIFDGRRVLPHDLFARDDVASYLRNLELALAEELDFLGEEGEVDVFVLSRRLGHRLGLRSWGGPAAAADRDFDVLVSAFDDLDGSESFVRPDLMSALLDSDKQTERAALSTITEIIGATVADFGDPGGHPLFSRIVAAWRDEPEDVARVGVARDVALIHVASMSNLFAALGWALIDLLAHPAYAARVVDGDQQLAESCALESTRLAQRSLMARYVMAPVSLHLSSGELAVSPGVTVATLLPLLNTTAAPGLDGWVPERWRRWRLADTTALAADELVTAFGHGKHSCPALPFSLVAMTTACSAILGRLLLTPRWTGRPQPEPAQIGGVARAAGPCPVVYATTSGEDRYGQPSASVGLEGS
jgi:cytochrome P450